MDRISRRILAALLAACTTLSVTSLASAVSITDDIPVVSQQISRGAVSSNDGIKFTKNSINLCVGEKSHVTVVALKNPSTAINSSCTYKSSDPKTVIVDKKGYIKGIKQGTVVITATYKGKTCKCTVSVGQEPTSISLNKNSVTLGVGEGFYIKTYSQDGRTINAKYTSNDKSICTVSSDGYIRPKKAGSTSIDVETYNGHFKVCYVTVENAPSKIEDVSDVTLGIGETYKLRAISYNKDDTCSHLDRFPSTSFSSSNSSVASVRKTDDGAVITAKKPGTANITVKTYNGKTATCKVTVKNAPTKISLNRTKLKLPADGAYRLKWSLPNDQFSNSNVTYTSSNPSVASVTKASGVVEAKKPGTTVITAKTYNGKTATCKVTVGKDLTANVCKLSCKNPTMSIGETQTPKFSSNGYDVQVRYSTDNPYIITVDSKTGKVTPKRSGTANVIAWAEHYNSYVTSYKKVEYKINVDFISADKGVSSGFINSLNNTIKTVRNTLVGNVIAYMKTNGWTIHVVNSDRVGNGNAVGTANFSQRCITIAGKSSVYSKQYTVRDVLTHELGHVLADLTIFNNTNSAKLKNSYSAEQWENIYNKESARAKNNNYNFMRKYAFSNSRELFADALAYKCSSNYCKDSKKVDSSFESYYSEIDKVLENSLNRSKDYVYVVCHPVCKIDTKNDTVTLSIEEKDLELYNNKELHNKYRIYYYSVNAVKNGEPSDGTMKCIEINKSAFKVNNVGNYIATVKIPHIELYENAKKGDAFIYSVMAVRYGEYCVTRPMIL